MSHSLLSTNGILLVITEHVIVGIQYTVQCRYNAVQSIMILQTVLRWQQRNVNQTLNSQQTGELQGVYCEDFGENWTRRCGGTVLYNECTSRMIFIIGISLFYFELDITRWVTHSPTLGKKHNTPFLIFTWQMFFLTDLTNIHAFSVGSRHISIRFYVCETTRFFSAAMF